MPAQVAAYLDVWAGPIQSLPTGMVTKPSVQLSSSTACVGERAADADGAGRAL